VVIIYILRYSSRGSAAIIFLFLKRKMRKRCRHCSFLSQYPKDMELEDRWFECPIYLSDVEAEIPSNEIPSNEVKNKHAKKPIVIDLTNDSSDEDADDVSFVTDIGITFSESDFYSTPPKPAPRRPKCISHKKKQELYERANDGPDEWKRIFNRGDGERCVYFVTMGEKEGPIKIGFSTRKASTRIKEYKAGNAYRLKVYCAVTVEDPKAWESIAHRIFYGRRMLEEGRSNEWFNITKADVDRFFSYDEVKYAFIDDNRDKAGSFSFENDLFAKDLI